MIKRITAVVATAVAIAVPCNAQSLTGKWLGETRGGGSLGLDLTNTGSPLTGTIIFIRGGQCIPIGINEADMTGSTFTIGAMADNDAAWAYSGDYSGDRITLRMLAPFASDSPIVLNRIPETTLDPLVTTAPASAPAGWRAYNRAATLVDEEGRHIVRVDSRLGDGVIWQEGSNFREGVIELEMRRRNVPCQSGFLGLAFRGANDTTYDAVYFRTFNFSAEEPGAVQYASHPDYRWFRLHAESPAQFENAISPVPDPDGWFRARIVIDGQTINVFVNDAPTPALTVNALTEPRDGMIGLWVGNGSGGDFANLELTRSDPVGAPVARRN